MRTLTKISDSLDEEFTLQNRVRKNVVPQRGNRPYKAAHFVGHWFPPWASQFPHRLIWGPPWGQSPPSSDIGDPMGSPMGPHGAPHGAPWGAQWGPVSPMGDNIFSYPILKGKYPIQRIVDFCEGSHIPLLCSYKI